MVPEWSLSHGEQFPFLLQPRQVQTEPWNGVAGRPVHVLEVSAQSPRDTHPNPWHGPLPLEGKAIHLKLNR